MSQELGNDQQIGALPSRVPSVASIKQPTVSHAHMSKDSTTSITSYRGTFGENAALPSPIIGGPPIILHQPQQASAQRPRSPCGPASPCTLRAVEVEQRNQQLKSEVDVLLRRVASQESAALDERERYMGELKLARMDMQQLREALQIAERRNEKEEASQITQLKREVEQSKEMAQKGSQDFERLMQQVVNLTRERDEGRKKLRAVKKAISFSTRESIDVVNTLEK